MTDVIDDSELKAKELEGLKDRATTLGITFHPSIGEAKLREKIKAYLESEGVEKNSPTQEISEEAKENQRRKKGIEEAGRLIRIRVTCMHPNKRNIPGEIFTASNALGTWRKYVPFNIEGGWHVPNIIYKMIKNKKCQVFVEGKNKNGVSTKRGQLIPAYSVEVLPPLTPEELHKLRQRQAMARGEE